MRETEAEVYVVNGGNDGGGGSGSGGGGGNDSSDDDDEDGRKLSTVQELPELTASPPVSLAMRQARERSQREESGEPRRDSDQPSDRNEAAISSISERVEARARKEGSCPNEEQILSYSNSPTFSEFSS
ncbi:U1 small nuclear ribonucleoprotein 70 kDa-like [Temnothorax curvispinosus]|uniref:U1 small nuclear ribonucleoprotein 70 kDa-like n=1 Tax=Temnothorax curvispinosus TaxID=300111 RepID=A0A6J1PGU9_9HYME|nr:U1 small nuclear ribonucleoprotein 70 kDa-like [Temnothorax curvispinosus]XP_024881089.1 U1 small nuclear ribonucleoprotein 70 kDa-like [Temnothorax curvispinosus]